MNRHKHARLTPKGRALMVERVLRQGWAVVLHIDTKKLGRIEGVGHRIAGDRTVRSRGIGWDAVHLAIDDHSRVVSYALGKAERFVQTSLREWAYAKPYESSAHAKPRCSPSSIATTGIGPTLR